MQSLDPYLKSTQIWDCPSWKGRYTNNPDYVGNYSYVTTEPPATNTNLFGAGGLLPASLAAVDEPTKHILLFCGAAPQQTAPSSINAHTGLDDTAWDAGTASDGLGGTNIGFADGHVKFSPLTRGTWNDMYNRPR